MRLARGNWLVAVAILGIGFFGAGTSWAHCDTMDGPVVKDAQQALDTGDITPVLKWVQPDKESEIHAAFEQTLIVRAKGPEAKELADRYFFETLVRVHRAGEGAPYTGLKPAGTPLEPGVAEADHALHADNPDELVKAATDAVSTGIRQRFARAAETRKHADHNVQAGREFVAAYVEFVHYAERIFAAASGPAHAHGEEAHPAAAPAHPHEPPAQNSAEHQH